MVKDISALFSRLPNRTARLKGVLRERAIGDPKAKLKMIGSYVEIRWTSFKDCLDTVVEQAESLRTYFLQEEDAVRVNYFETENLIMLRLISALLSKLHFYIMEFQKDDMDIIQVVKTLKMCPTSIGGYIFRQEVNPGYIKKYSALFDDIKPLFNVKEESQTYQERLLTRTEFIAYFLKRNPDFGAYHTWSEAFQKTFFDVSFEFFRVAFRGIKPQTAFGIF